MHLIALYPGSFDPPTIGHLDIIRRAAQIYDVVYVAVMINVKKKCMFDAETRVDMLKKCLNNYENVVVMEDRGLLVELARKLHVNVLVRGLRDAADYAAEKPVADAIRAMSGIETLFMQADPMHGYIYSSLVREILSFDGSIDALVPPEIVKDVYRLHKGQV